MKKPALAHRMKMYEGAETNRVFLPLKVANPLSASRKVTMELRDLLWKVCRDTQAYEDGPDTKRHELPDCSCGCKWFVELSGKAGMDWGVCSQLHLRARVY
jgi:hypothetical protein